MKYIDKDAEEDFLTTTPEVKEIIKIIEKYDLNFNIGNALILILRSGTKYRKEVDYLKASLFLDREIKRE